MPILSIKIHRQNNPNPAYPDLKVDENAEITGVVVMEGGMESGKTAVSFHIKTDSGKIVWFQTSVDLLKGLMGAIKGAEENWSENPVENIWNKEEPPKPTM